MISSRNSLSLRERLQRNSLYQRALELQARQDYAAALSEVERLLAQSPQVSELWYLQGDILANLGRYEDAIAQFDRLVDDTSDAVAALVFQAVCQIHLDRPELALALCDRALALAPRHVEAWTFRGVALHRLGQYQESYKSYDMALRIKRLPFWQRVMNRCKRIVRRCQTMVVASLRCREAILR